MLCSPNRRPLRSAIFALPLVAMCVAVRPALSQTELRLQTGNEFRWNGCYARFANGHLAIGNTHIAREWKVQDGQLFPESLRDEDTGYEWIGAPVVLPAPAPPEMSFSGHSELRGADGVFGPTEEHSLRIELQTAVSHGTVRYEFEVFPQASGVRMWIEQSGSADSATPSTLKATPSHIDTTSAEKLPETDVLERLKLTSPHIRLIQITLRDRTDNHNELAFEDEWLLHPNESGLKLQGNLFVLEDALTRNGIIFLKEAPQPEMRPLPSAEDVWIDGNGMSQRDRNDNHGAPAYDVVFTGHGFVGDGRGYAYTLLTYQGGERGRIAALHDYQRQIRSYLPGRDGLLITNTWGDRSGSSKIDRAFVEREIDGAKLLGADLMQVDDGWENGKTTASHNDAGIWEGYWAKANFWIPEPKRFPGGLASIAAYAHSRGLKLGLWFGPDSSHDFQSWQRDAGLILDFHNEAHIDAFKLDSVKIRTKLGETNYSRLLNRLQQKTGGAMLLDLDVTAETRQGYFGDIAAGPLFVENRYTDLHRYWPHQTLRNFWKLSHYIDPVRLRMEFLNNARNMSLYGDDPLAPAQYDPACLFAITMFGSPLGWFETTGLSSEYRAAVAPVIATWKQNRDAIYRGTILPIGDVPDGVNWTGFTSLDPAGYGYLLAFRERNSDADWLVPADLSGTATVLAGDGSLNRRADGRWTVHINKPLGFLWVHYTSSPTDKQNLAGTQ